MTNIVNDFYQRQLPDGGLQYKRHTANEGAL